ncbi:MAG: LVIVD repeat-containing protein, partial [Thermoplasmatota archaeon]
DQGMVSLDVTDPAHPKELSKFTDFGPAKYRAIHMCRAFPELTAGKQISVCEPEIGGAQDTGYMTFLDTTDPAHPAKISWWTLPAQDPPLGVRDLDFSPHNFDVWDGKLVLAHYHAGVWVIDVHDQENLKAPKTVGFYMPAKPRADLPDQVLQPDVWGVQQKDGYLYASDMATGLYILKYTGP